MSIFPKMILVLEGNPSYTQMQIEKEIGKYYTAFPNNKVLYITQENLLLDVDSTKVDVITLSPDNTPGVIKDIGDILNMYLLDIRQYKALVFNNSKGLYAKGMGENVRAYCLHYNIALYYTQHAFK